MMYRCVAENRIYTEDQLRSLFRLAEYNGWHDDFDVWVKMEIEKGYLEVVEDEQRTNNILEYMSGEKKIDMN